MQALKDLYAKIPASWKGALLGAASTYVASNYGPFAQKVFECVVK